MAFHPNDLPDPVRKSFNKYFKTAAMWPLVVKEAIRSGIRDINVLTDIVFYLHNWDRINNPIKSHETQMIKAWKGFREMVRPMVPHLAKVTADEEDWKLTNAECGHIRSEMGGNEMLDWAMARPTGVETKEFAPVKKKDYKAVMAWKAPDARKCVAQPKKRIQAVLLLRSDLSYWRSRCKGDETAAQILSTSAATCYRDYRRLVIAKQMCPPSAYQYLAKVSRDVAYEMFLGMFQVLSPHGARPIPTKLTGGGQYAGAQGFGSPSGSAMQSMPGLIDKFVQAVAYDKDLFPAVEKTKRGL